MYRFTMKYKMFSCRREIELQRALVLAKSGILELGDNILRIWGLSVTRNSSGDEIANVNFLYDDIVHALRIQ